MRDPARSDSEARSRYTGYLQRALSCVSQAVWTTGPPPRGPEDALALSTSEDPVRLRTEGDPLFLTAGQLFHFTDHPVYTGERKVSTDAYSYHVRSSDIPNGEMFQWHWHPDVEGRSECHIHIGAVHEPRGHLGRLHVPTSRVSFEQVLLFLIHELGVVPIREDWQDVLQDTEKRFEEYRSLGRGSLHPPISHE